MFYIIIFPSEYMTEPSDQWGLSTFFFYIFANLEAQFICISLIIIEVECFSLP